MPKPTLNVDSVVQTIVELLAPEDIALQQEMKLDYQMLDKRIRQQQFPWQMAASMLQISKNKLYHWYQDTFTRNLYEKMTSDDLAIVKQYVRSCFEKNVEPDREKLAAMLKKEYHQKVLKVAFRNACQVCKSEQHVQAPPKQFTRQLKPQHIKLTGFELTPRDEQDEFVYVADDWM